VTDPVQRSSEILFEGRPSRTSSLFLSSNAASMSAERLE
jgi:hypothetical protein